MLRWARSRRVLLIGGSLLVLAIGLALCSYPVRAWGRTRARRDWLAGKEAEIRQFMAKGPVAPTRPGPDNWFDKDFARFDDGWAVWRVNSFHSDPGHGSDWSGVGNIAILIDGQGRPHYSRSHFCDGTLGWALNYPYSPLPARPANVAAFLALFRPGTWTDDRAAVEAAIPAESH